jgi:glycosyltransferase involved in cell wall biosynthesis
MDALDVRNCRVLFALSNLFSEEQVIGGAELGTLIVMRALRTIGMQPYVVMHGLGHFGELLRREGIEFEIVPLSEKVAKLSRNRSIVWQCAPICLEIIHLATAVTRIARRWKVNLLHASHLYGYIACGLAARGMRIPCIWHLHEAWEKSTITKVLEFTGRTLANHVITIAPYEASTVALTGRVPHTLIENAFDFKELTLSRNRFRHEVRAEFGVSPSEILIGYVSHLAPYKGQRTFVRALSHLANSGRVFKAIIVGGPRKSFEWFQPELQAAVDELGFRAGSFLWNTIGRCQRHECNRHFRVRIVNRGVQPCSYRGDVFWQAGDCTKSARRVYRGISCGSMRSWWPPAARSCRMPR